MSKFVILFIIVLFNFYLVFTEQAAFLSKERIQQINEIATQWKVKLINYIL